VRRLRKAGPAHRGFRPRLLSAAAAAVLAAALLAALGACSPSARPATGAAPKSAGSAAAPREPTAWFQLQSGTFQPVAGPAASLSTSPRPWTVQSRVADLAFLDDTLYAAVNGWGLATIRPDQTGKPGFSYYFDSLIFGHRTITTLVPRKGTLAVHLYFNALLNDARRQDLPVSGICLVSFLPPKADYTFLIPPFQRQNPDWEAVGFSPSSESRFDFEWKFTDASETRFAYTRYDADTEQEQKESRDSYLAALGAPSISGEGIPGDLAAFFSACRDSLSGLPADVSLQFALRIRDSAVRKSFRSKPGSDTAVVIPIFQEPSKRLALLPVGRVLTAVSGGAPRVVELPPLPKGYRYTDLVALGEYLAVPWEQSTFTDVGSAGILLFRL
jgi:hypothetical protein